MTASTDPAAAPRLRAEGLKISYGALKVLQGLDFEVAEGRLTAIIGPNACGKSTLLRALARLIRPGGGHVLLDGSDIARLPTRDVALKLGVLAQSPTAPSGVLVADLVARGRTPHQRAFRHWSRADEAAVEAAMRSADVLDLADRPVDALSGGQRQRVWIAMALAQETALLLLDEPTSFLDLAHQIDLLELIQRLKQEGRTIVTVLHDVNLAARYADVMVAMRGGEIRRIGAPAEVVSAANMKEIYGLDCVVIEDPARGGPMVVPS